MTCCFGVLVLDGHMWSGSGALFDVMIFHQHRPSLWFSSAFVLIIWWTCALIHIWFNSCKSRFSFPEMKCSWLNIYGISVVKFTVINSHSDACSCGAQSLWVFFLQVKSDSWLVASSLIKVLAMEFMFMVWFWLLFWLSLQSGPILTQTQVLISSLNPNQPWERCAVQKTCMWPHPKLGSHLDHVHTNDFSWEHVEHGKKRKLTCVCGSCRRRQVGGGVRGGVKFTR